MPKVLRIGFVFGMLALVALGCEKKQEGEEKAAEAPAAGEEEKAPELTGIDLWPNTYSTSFALREGKRAVPPGHEDFYHNYRAAGNLPGERPLGRGRNVPGHARPESL